MMSIISKVLSTLSILQLVHSGFSSFEFYQLKKQLSLIDGLQQDITLPYDIQLEVLCGLLLFTLSVFLSFEKLKYIPLVRSRELLTQNQYLQEIQMNKATKKDNLIGNDPFGEFSCMPSFINIHRKRKEIRDYLSIKEVEKE
ncbi:Emc5p Ecym_4354 [Eremothecium cymbalariae DBVPG|uniref:ER membrane protein complex subunit 5 n=1 Tax=Eremothecium cymbalariae (strain CBS 270.75 / DBVPG 7215 / KCTC 17166 / NRRL Y-17582) TaxID=931890 RepID=G8JTR1_ERECY|nr:hypothetical protein Ecym_4354 [Eremothecium cymbalariae DBVPG\